MWISAWLLVASGALYQPNLPPFYSRQDCEAAKRIYLRSRADTAADCIEARVFITGARA